MTNIKAPSRHLITPELPELPDQLLSYLCDGAIGLILSVCEDEYPTDAFTWVIALDSKRLRMVADHGGRTLGNLLRDGRAVIQIIGPDNLVFLVRGTTRQVKENLDATSIGVALFEMHVISARDQSWPAAIPLPLTIQWAGDTREAMVQMEQAVYAEMRECTG